MTDRKRKRLLAATTGLVVLAMSGAAVAAEHFSIAPFSFRAKARQFTFYAPAPSGFTFLGSRVYFPKAATRTGANQSGARLTGPIVVHVPYVSGQYNYYASNYYAFNPYWGAQMGGGITAISGLRPQITMLPGLARLRNTSNPSNGPDFTVPTGQIRVVATDYPSAVSIWG